MLFLTLFLVSFVFRVWMIIRVWSAAGAIWGLGCIFVPFVPTIYILTHWGEDDGAKVPFFASCLFLFVAYTQHPALQASRNRDVATAMTGSPEIQQQMTEELIGSDSDFADDGIPDSQQGLVSSSASPPPAFRVTEAYSANEQQAWKLAMSNLPRRRGTVALAGNSASIELPERMAFVERQPLALALASSKESLDDDVIGWVVHDDAPIDDRFNAWWIEVRSVDKGHVPLGDVASANRIDEWKERAFGIASEEGKQSGKLLSFLGFPVAPWVDGDAALVAWIASYGAGGEQAHLCTGLALGKERQVAYTMRVKYDDRWQELCLLSVRTLARRTEFEAGQGYADYTRFVDDRSDVDAVDYVVGAKRIGKGL